MRPDQLSVPPGLRHLLILVGYACFIGAADRGLRDIAFLAEWAPEVKTVLVIVSNTTFILSLIIASIIVLKRHGRPATFFVDTAGMGLLCLGFLASIASAIVPATGLVLLMGGGIAFGIGGTLGFFSWIDALEQEGDDAKYLLVAGSLVAGLLGLGLGRLSDSVVVPIICLFIALFSLLCRSIVRRGLPVTNFSKQYADESSNNLTLSAAVGRLLSHTWRPGLCVGTLGMISIVSRHLVATQTIDVALLASTLGEILPCLLLLVLFALPSFTGDVAQAYKFLFPIAALLFIMLVFVGDFFVLPLAIFSGAAFQTCVLLIVLQSLDIGKSLRFPARAVYGFLHAMTIILTLAGYPVIPLGREYFGIALYPVVAVLMVYVLSMGLLVGLTAAKLDIQVVDSPEEPRWKSALRADGKDGAFAQANAGKQPVTMQDSVDVMALSADLSAREIDVMRYLVAGRDAPYIADALVLSKNTVRTHIKSIYSKFGVHSRQELIDYFEETHERHGEAK